VKKAPLRYVALLHESVMGSISSNLVFLTA